VSTVTKPIDRPAAPVPVLRRNSSQSASGMGTSNVWPPVHVLLRVRSENGLTIAAHTRMVASKGAAVIGKMGQAIGPEFRRRLNGQIERGVATYLFLTTREGWNGPYVTYRCQMRQVSNSLDPDKRSLVPSYYIDEASKVSTWFEITGIARLTRDEMSRLVVLNSGRSIMSVIASSAAVFRVYVQADT
jgi:hypothetical protein